MSRLVESTESVLRGWRLAGDVLGPSKLRQAEEGMCNVWRILMADVMQVRRLSEHVSIPLRRSSDPAELTSYRCSGEKRPDTSLIVEKESAVWPVEGLLRAPARELVEEPSFALKGEKDGFWPAKRAAQSKST